MLWMSRMPSSWELRADKDPNRHRHCAKTFTSIDEVERAYPIAILSSSVDSSIQCIIHRSRSACEQVPPHRAKSKTTVTSQVSSFPPSKSIHIPFDIFGIVHRLSSLESLHPAPFSPFGASPFPSSSIASSTSILLFRPRGFIAM